MRITGLLFALFAVACSTSGVLAQKFPSEGYSSITEERSRNLVHFLASDMLEGREAGMRGGNIAAEYIVSMFREWGIEPFNGNSYFQHFIAVRNGNNWITEADTDLQKFIDSGCELESFQGKKRVLSLLVHTTIMLVLIQHSTAISVSMVQMTMPLVWLLSCR